MSYRGSVVGALPLLGSAGEEVFTLPTSVLRSYGYLLRLTVDFTDVAGIRWRTDVDGALRRAQHGVSGSEVWGPRMYADIREVAMGGPVAGASRPPAPSHAVPSAGTEVPVSRRTRFLRPAVVLVSLLLIAGGVWWLINHY
ncbi:hypothetical protein CA983_44230 [Streptomyces swartbergensis]|uniref:Uncharacterized protein n=1 Tax=Streptomyces swartbergensis TaxID=487165 RepID=A0A243Q3U4_9ACTN|nr:hypothetical protein CA983_44230 [Streptomyces swartbergensis]